MAALGVFQRRTEISDAPGIAALIDAGSRTEELFGDINIVTAMYAPHTNTAQSSRCCRRLRLFAPPPTPPFDAPRLVKCDGRTPGRCIWSFKLHSWLRLSARAAQMAGTAVGHKAVSFLLPLSCDGVIVQTSR